jgi:hypothetical protein
VTDPLLRDNEHSGIIKRTVTSILGDTEKEDLPCTAHIEAMDDKNHREKKHYDGFIRTTERETVEDPK